MLCPLWVCCHFYWVWWWPIKGSISTGQAVDAVGADVKRFSVETLPELERLLGELGALATSLRRLSDQTERDPRGLIFGRQPVPAGPGEKGVSP